MGFENRNISWKDTLFMRHIRMLLRVGVLLANKVSCGINQTARGIMHYFCLEVPPQVHILFSVRLAFSNWFSCIFYINLHFTSKYLMCCIPSTLWLCFYLLAFLRIEILSKLSNIFIFPFDIFVLLKKCGAWAGEMIQL